MHTKKRILLTGASGNIGREVLAQLIRYPDKYDIVVIGRPGLKTQKFFRKYRGRIRIFKGDISYYEQVEAACTNVDTVIHLAAVIPPLADDNPKLAHRVNVVGTQNIIKALEKKSPDAFLLYSSSVAVYGDRLSNPEIKVSDPITESPQDEYSKTKIEAEKLIQNSGLDWSIFRLTAIMGFKNHKMSKLMFRMPLATQMEIATVEDTARAFVNAIQKKQEINRRIFNLGGGPSCRITYREFLEKNFEVYGLGKFDLPEEAFARKNFHCGNYMDGDELEEILHFRRSGMDDYLNMHREKISRPQYYATRLLSPIIKKRLLNLSEPWKALKENDEELYHRFF